jgi:succinate dehydrogenase/fumarate reductase-like Fe-S protein
MKNQVREYTFTNKLGTKISIVFKDLFEIIPWINENLDPDLNWKMSCKKVEI